MTTQTETETLAEWLDNDACDLLTPRKAAAELRRLAAANAELEQMNTHLREQNDAIDGACAKLEAANAKLESASTATLSPVHCERCAEMCYDAPPAPQPAQQEPVAELLKQSRENFARNFGKGGQGWADWIYGDIAELLSEYTSPQPAQRPHECSRSHNENARLKAASPDRRR